MSSVSWQRNLYAITFVELVVIMGFGFPVPFMSLFVQELGNFTEREAALWSGIAMGASGLAMFIGAPLWGILADRWGRKRMLMRAMFGGGAVLALLGLAPNIPILIVLRFAQGFLSGTLAAAQSLVAATAPRNKLSFAMGLLMMALYGGSSVGPFFGGLMAQAFGYRATFYITGAVLVAGGLAVAFVVKEQFVAPPRSEAGSWRSVLTLARSRELLPLLLVFCALSAGTQMIGPIIPLAIGNLDPTGSAPLASGLAFGLAAVASALSALAAGRFGGRFGLKRLMIFSAVGTGLLFLPPMFAGNVAQMVVFVALSGLLQGGLLSSSNTLVGLAVPAAQQGVAYGVATSANALGNGLGPLLSGGLAPALGLQPIFGVTGLLFMLVALLIWKLPVTAASSRA